MQTANKDLPITVTGRHVSITEAMRDYALKKVQGLHLDYPRIIEAKVILDVPKGHRQFAEIILFCAGHITIEADSETTDIYASIDETISKIARRMRKYKTRLLSRKYRPRKSDAIRRLEEQVFTADSVEQADEDEPVEPVIVHKEKHAIRPLYPDEAIMDLEMSERPFVVFQNVRTTKLALIFRRKDGDYGMIEPQIPED